LPDEAYDKLVKRVAPQSEYAVEFLELYPQAFQQPSRMFMHIGPMRELADNGNPWDFMAFITPLYGRYQFRCFIPFYLSADYTTVEPFGDPSCDLYATTSFERKSDGGLRAGGRHINFPGDLYRYELDDWIWFEKHDRDWDKIGVLLVTDAPWPGYDEYCRRNMIR
jgi:hypothetical protein